MPLTIPQLNALDLGYLNGSDLTDWISANLLIKVENEKAGALLKAANTAIGEIQSAARTKYDLSTELTKRDDARDVLLVKLVSILAVRNAAGSLQNVGDILIAHFDWADAFIKAIRSGQANLMQPLPAKVTIDNPDGTQTIYTPQSVGQMVQSSFLTLG